MADTTPATSAASGSGSAPVPATAGAPSHNATTVPFESTAPVVSPNTLPNTTETISNDEVQPEAASQPPRSKLAQLRQNEQHWIWKFGLRVIIIVINIIAIGSAGWVLSTTTNIANYPYSTSFGTFRDAATAAIVPLSFSTVFCAIFIAIPFIRRTPRPAHPGIAVGFDLVLWLGFIAAGLFTIPAIYEILSIAHGGTIDDPTYDSGRYYGDYYYNPSTDSLIYNITRVYDSTYYNYTTMTYDLPPPDVLASLRECTPTFPSCAAQDAFVNMIYHTRNTRVALQVLITAVCFLDVLLHFTLFVWACVETQRINNNKATRKERIIAERIIGDLEKRGLVMVQNGVVVGQTTIAQQQAQAQQQWQQQWYQQQNLQAQQGQLPVQTPGQEQPSSSSAVQRPPQAYGQHPATGFYGNAAEHDEAGSVPHAR